MLTHEIIYLQRREQSEWQMAHRAACNRAKSAHEVLANTYAERRALLMGSDDPSGAASRVSFS